MANELINSRPNKNSILFVLEDSLVSLRGEYRKQARNDGGSRSELVLASLVQTQGTDCIGNGLDDLDKRQACRKGKRVVHILR
jgi:hypothetical protein